MRYIWGWKRSSLFISCCCTNNVETHNDSDSPVILKPRGFLPLHVLPVETSNLPYQGWFSQGGDPQNGSVASRVSPSWPWRKKNQEWPMISRWNRNYRYWVIYFDALVTTKMKTVSEQCIRVVITIVSDQNNFREMSTNRPLSSFAVLLSDAVEKLWSQNSEI